MQIDIHTYRPRLIEELNRFVDAGAPGALFVFRLPLPAHSLTSWIATQRIYPRFYWQSPDRNFEVAGVGNSFAAIERRGANMANSLLQAERFLETSPFADQALFFYAGAFDPLNWDLQEWRGFSPTNLIHPQVALVRERYKTELAVSLLVHPGDQAEELYGKIVRLIEIVRPEEVKRDRTKYQLFSRSDSPDASHWARNVALASARIAHGDLEKVVLARRTRIALGATPSAYEILNSLLGQSSDLYGFVFEPKSGHAFLGASPECFLRVEGREVESESLGGTYFEAGANGHAAARLLSSEKDRMEHEFVTSYLRRCFLEFSTEVQVEANPSVRKFSSLCHLSTKVKGLRKSGTSISELASTLHPTPAVSGTPSELARDVIRRLEPFSRGLYSGPIGVLRKDRVDLAVALRSVVLHGRSAVLYAGAGIVNGSKAQREWEELEAKIRGPLQILKENSVDQALEITA